LVESNLVHFKEKGMSDVTENLTLFPDGTHDDIVDGFVHALSRMKVGSIDPVIISF